MQTKLPSRVVIIGIAIALLIGAYYGVRALTNGSSGPLKASGTIETVSVNLSPELSGRVKVVLVDEGQAVISGEALFVLDDTLLQEQRNVAVAGLDAAKAASVTAQNALDITQAQYQNTLEAALAKGKAKRLQDWFTKDQEQFNQPNWYFSRAEQVQAVQTQMDEAKKAWDAAQANLTAVTQALDKADFQAAEQRVLNARVAYLISKDVNHRGQNSIDATSPLGLYNKAHCGTDQGYRMANGRVNKRVIDLLYGCSGNTDLATVSDTLLNDAQAELTSAQQAYDALLTTKAADDVLRARAEVAVAQERYYAALDRLSGLQTDDQTPTVTAAQGAVDQAKANYDQSQKGVAQAQANLNLLEAQLAKLTVYAPTDGVILTRSVEPGEFVQPGAAALTMGNISQLTITVYVPEDRYGQIHLGQQASVKVDSFPNLVFTAQITNISDQAEFTPRNVQTVEGRSSTVYAIKLTVTDPQGKLKPGMPADVTFISK